MQNIKDHHDIDLLISAKGVPRPTLKWFCNDAEMNEQFYQNHKKYRLSTIDAENVTETLHIDDFNTSDICSVSLNEKWLIEKKIA